MAEPTVTAASLRRAFLLTELWLTTNRDGLNAINVYPVPDGDTGTNMLLTWRAALRAAEDAPDDPVALTATFARGALLGARGNSGVILSQMLRGLAEGTARAGHLGSGEAMAAVLRAASVAADAAVSTPVEGTMLTVLRDAAAAAERAAGVSTQAVLDAATREAFASVARTPLLLPRLREAGVVDSGGMGVAVILQGITCGLTDAPLPARPAIDADASVTTAAIAHEGHGFCVEYLVVGSALDRVTMERELSNAGGTSIIVVGDPATQHVHVHAENAERIVAIGQRFGLLEAVKVENMQAQHEAWRSGHDEPAVRPALGLVAVATGGGLVTAFRELGAGAIVDSTTKASAGDLLDAARRAGRDHAIILPNDRDMLMAAEQAARTAEGFITVVPTRSVAAGLSAALAYHADGVPTQVADAMRHAAAVVHTVEVTRATRDARVDEVSVTAGAAITFVDGRLRLAARDLDEALFAGIAAAVTDASDASIVTVCLGADAPTDAATLAARIEERFPELEVDVVFGGQPYYHYIAGVE